MANRCSSWFFPLLIVLAVSEIESAHAKPRDLSSYPLRVHIFQSHWQPAGGFGNFGQGSGMANLIDGEDIHGFDFSYSCPINYMESLGNQAYAAKWKKPGKTIEVVGSAVGNQNESNSCEFKVTLHDYVYDVQNGTLSTFTQEQYKVRIGAALPKTGPIDADINHYPLRVSVLAVDWTSPLNGTRSGSGRGNLVTPDGVSSIDFTTSCILPFPRSPDARYYAGKWVREGSTLVLLFHTAAESGTSLLCTLQTNIHTDIYVRDSSGAIKAVSAEEFRRTTSEVAVRVASTAQAGHKSEGEPPPSPGAATSPTTLPIIGLPRTLQTKEDLKAGVLPAASSGSGGAVQKVGNPSSGIQSNTAEYGASPSPDKSETTVVVTGPPGGGKASTSPKSTQAAALYRQACDGGSAGGCRNLAIMYSLGNGVSQDYGQAAALYRKACDGGDAGSCTNLGLLYANGSGVSQDYAQAVALYHKACDAGAGIACSNLGLMYARGTGLPRDYSQAVTLYRKACDAGVAAGCSNLGIMYADGTGVPRDYSQAVTLYRRTCDGGDLVSCGNLGGMYANGTGVPQDYNHAVTLFRKACDAGVTATCGNLGVMYARGNGVPRDDAQALTLYRKACDAGYMAGCGNLGVMYANGTGVPRDDSQAATLYRKACDAGLVDTCVNLGNMYEAGIGVSRDHAQAVSLFRKACDGGAAIGCNNLGVLYEKETGARPPQ